MGREVWGTYAVGDHTRANAFVADVLLFDRLAVPVPVDAEERAKWNSDGNDVERLDHLLEILGDNAHPLSWSAYESGWRNRYDEIQRLAWDLDPRTLALASEAEFVADSLPDEVTGIDAVTTYPSIKSLRKEMDLRPPDTLYPRQSAAVVIGRRILTPNEPKMSESDLLQVAVELSDSRDFDRKRRAYWRWYRDLAGGVISTQAALDEAIEELADLVADEQEAIRRAGIRTKVNFAFTLTSAVVGLLAAPLAPIAIGGTFLSVGQFAATELFDRRWGSLEPSAAALVLSGRRAFGWTSESEHP
jgi:hypothetical protein